MESTICFRFEAELATKAALVDFCSTLQPSRKMPWLALVAPLECVEDSALLLLSFLSTWSWAALFTLIFLCGLALYFGCLADDDVQLLCLERSSSWCFFWMFWLTAAKVRFWSSSTLMILRCLLLICSTVVVLLGTRSLSGLQWAKSSMMTVAR